MQFLVTTDNHLLMLNCTKLSHFSIINSFSKPYEFTRCVQKTSQFPTRSLLGTVSRADTEVLFKVGSLCIIIMAEIYTANTEILMRLLKNLPSTSAIQGSLCMITITSPNHCYPHFLHWTDVHHFSQVLLLVHLLVYKIINCKKMQGWYAKKYANKVGMMHESKGQRIGKAPSLQFFHTTVIQTASLRAAAGSSPIHTVNNTMHKYLSFIH